MKRKLSKIKTEEPKIKVEKKNLKVEKVEVSEYKTPKLMIGGHLSIAKGYKNAVQHSKLLGAKAFAMDLRNKRRQTSPPLQKQQITEFRQACELLGFDPETQVLPHASYLINLASPKPEILEKSRIAFLDEMDRCHKLGIKLYNFHPGSTTNLCTIDQALLRIAEELNHSHKQIPFVVTVIENMAGQGYCVGQKFEHLRKIIDNIEMKDRVGVCLDTCHMFAAGYDIRTKSKQNNVLDEFDRIVGLKYLKAIHLNDSKSELNSRRDRHENLGCGHLTKDFFHAFIKDKRVSNIPIILETPSMSDIETRKKQKPFSIDTLCDEEQKTKLLKEFKNDEMLQTYAHELKYLAEMDS